MIDNTFLKRIVRHFSTGGYRLTWGVPKKWCSKIVPFSAHMPLFFHGWPNAGRNVNYAQPSYTRGMESSYPNIEAMQLDSCPAGKTILSVRVLTSIYKKHFKKHNITLSQWGILSVLAKARRLPQAELGRLMLLERSTVSRDLKRLADRGYVERKGAVNRRMLEITTRGLAYIEAVIPDWENAKAEANELLGEEGKKALTLVVSNLTFPQ